MAMPEDLGGANLIGLDAQIVAEEMGWGAADIAVSLGAAAMPFSTALLSAQMTGNQRMMDEIVMPYVKDREAKVIGCWAITEPQHGSDTLAVGVGDINDERTAFDTRGRRDGDDWLISGAKAAWVSNGTIASHAMVHFAVDRSKGMAGSAIAIVPLDLPGVSRGKPLEQARAARPQPGRALLRRRAHPQ